MDIKQLTQEVLLKNMTPEQQLAVLDSVTASVKEAKAIQKQKIAENVDLVLQALKRIETDMLARVQNSSKAVEARVKTIKDGKDGVNGLQGDKGDKGDRGFDGKDGRNGRDGKDGKDGVDGVDGIGVSNAHIDFDGSLIITLSTGQELNVGEVVSPDLADKIKVVANGGGTSQYVLDLIANLQAEINAISPTLVITDTFVVSSQAQMLALTTAEKGDIAVRTDLSKTFILKASPYSTLSNWQELLTPTDLVTSVAGRTGAVTLTTADIGGLGTIATQNANNVAITGGLISNTILSGATIDNSAPYLNFANGSAVTVAAGRLWYDGNTGSWNAGMGGGNITQQIGEELFVYGKASAAITDSPLQIIYQTGTVGASGVVTFAPTVAGITNGDIIIGVATEPLALNAFGRITSWGLIHGVTTDGTAYGETWADNDTIWYNPVTGNPTKVKPVAPNIKVSLGTVIKAGPGGSGSFSVEISHGSMLGGTDSNVQLTSEATNDILQRNASGYWVNVTPATARTNLGLAIGTNVQAWDADLDAIAALSGTAGFAKKTAANTWTLDTSTYLTSAVTSVGGAGAVSGLTLTGTVTSTGNLTLGGTLAVTPSNFASQTANTVLAAPNGVAGVPTFRTLVAADVPTLNQNTTGSAGSVVTTGFSIVESGGKLLFKFGATTIASMSSTGVITSATNIVSNGTP